MKKLSIIFLTFIFSFCSLVLFPTTKAQYAEADNLIMDSAGEVNDATASTITLISPYACEHCGTKLGNVLSNRTVEEGTTERPVFSMKTFFENLNDNMATNHNTCGYVCISSILAYYDTFVNDDVIPTVYERTTTSIEVSPGVRQDGMTDNSLYHYYVDFEYDTDFQAYLIRVLSAATNSSYKYAINNTDVATILQNYSEQSMFTYTTYDSGNIEALSVYSSAGQEELKGYIRAAIDANKPVIASIQQANKQGGHGVIAYDYDEETIYANYGWVDSGKTHYPLLSDDFCYVFAVGVINFTGSHLHSNNYDLETGEYCGCGLSSHTHDLTWTRTLRMHAVSCNTCNYALNGPHTYEVCVGCTFSICNVCGYKITH